MHRSRQFAPELLRSIDAQDGLVTRSQLAAFGFGDSHAYRRITAGQWQRLLPGVVLTNGGAVTRRQLVLAAWLWGGPSSAIDGASACAWYGLHCDGFDHGRVHLVVPLESGLRSQSYVTVRRSIAEIPEGGHTPVRYVDAPTALIVAARGARTARDAVALLSRGLQMGMVTLEDLRRAREHIGDKWCRGVDGALVAVGVGLRSPAEKDARDLILTSRSLPEPLWNQWVDLGDGGSPVCLDALWKEAALVHEVNGKRYHAWGNQFDDMHVRAARLTAAGLIVVQSTAVQVRRDGPATLARLELTHARYNGQELPRGVTLVKDPGNRV